MALLCAKIHRQIEPDCSNFARVSNGTASVLISKDDSFTNIKPTH